MTLRSRLLHPEPEYKLVRLFDHWLSCRAVFMPKDGRWHCQLEPCNLFRVQDRITRQSVGQEFSQIQCLIVYVQPEDIKDEPWHGKG